MSAWVIRECIVTRGEDVDALATATGLDPAMVRDFIAGGDASDRTLAAMTRHLWSTTIFHDGEIFPAHHWPR